LKNAVDVTDKLIHAHSGQSANSILFLRIDLAGQDHYILTPGRAFSEVTAPTD
jgi:hypothetical protein